MGLEYYLLNDTKKECVHYDHRVKYSDIRSDPVTCMNLVYYMLDHSGDILRIVTDYEDELIESYKLVDLKREYRRQREWNPLETFAQSPPVPRRFSCR